MEVNEDENLAVEALGQLGNSCRTWTCESCDRMFFSEPEFNDHLHNHEERENEEYCCNLCPEKFKLKIALDAHELTHLTAERLEYQCEVCLMWFQRLSSLKNHERVHMPNSYKDALKNKKKTIKRLQKKKFKRSDKREPPSPAFELITNSAYSSEEDNTVNESEFVDTEYTTHSDGENDQPSELENKDLIFPNGINNISDIDPLKPHVCIFCGKKFAREKALLSHMKLHDDNFEAVFLTCTKCDASFEDFLALQEHVATCVIKKEPVGIDSDGSDDYFNPFIEKSTSKKYLQSSFPKKPKREPTNNDERSTLFRVSSGKYACDQCPKSFKTRQKLFRHVWIHRTKQYKCDLCEAAFYTSGKLQDHKDTFHSSDTPFVCFECKKGYTSLEGLTEHKQNHEIKAQEMSCPYCMKKFSSRQGFTIHQRIHTGERPYICEYCTKAFRDGATLRKHELIHTGERPFVCPLCKSSFNQKVVLREHIRGVHVLKSKSNICNLCKMEKPDSESLSEHLVKHSDDIRVPLMPRKKNPFIIRWTGPSQTVSPGQIPSAKRIGGKMGRPKGSKNKTRKDNSNQSKLPVKKMKRGPYKKKKKTNVLKQELPSVRKSNREKKPNLGLSDYVQEDLDLLHANSTKQQEKVIIKRVINRSKNTSIAASTPNIPVSKKKPITIKRCLNKKAKKSVKSTKRKNQETDEFSDEEITNSHISVKSTIILGEMNKVEHTPLLSFTEVCAMCNEKFTSREDLITHVAIHI